VFSGTCSTAEPGSFRFGPYGINVPTARAYVPGTNVLTTTWHTPGSFLICSFWLVSALAMVGDTEEATGLMERLLRIGSPLGLYAENSRSRAPDTSGTSLTGLLTSP
jgi:GH15 family glucan-1,4-alpha-glucosidase